jgi:uncharacterized membrane protein YidH (DUF202 family)
VKPFGQVHDAGLQQERTSLAWDRTGLAIMVTSGFLFRVIGQPYPQAMHTLPIITFLIGLLLVASDRHRYLARWQRLQHGRDVTSWPATATVGITTTLLGFAALAVLALTNT